MEAVTPTMERELEQSGALMVQTAAALTIATHDDYDRGTAILKDIKARVKAVKDYWKEPKAAAQAAHKALCAREAQMLKPLEDAESTVKRAMLAYDTEVKRRRREAEEAARKAREAEVARLEAIAAQADAQGDIDAAEVMRDMAEDVPIGDIAAPAAPAVKGACVRTVWKARVTDPKVVPAYHDGVELRSINMAALNSLARYSKGQATIPGVEFYEESTLAVRA